MMKAAERQFNSRSQFQKSVNSATLFEREKLNNPKMETRDLQRILYSLFALGTGYPYTLHNNIRPGDPTVGGSGYPRYPSSNISLNTLHLHDTLHLTEHHTPSLNTALFNRHICDSCIDSYTLPINIVNVYAVRIIQVSYM